MTGKERILTLLKGQKPDRIPLGFYVVDCDTISSIIGRKTLVRNKIAQQIALWQGRRSEIVESLKKDVIDFYRKIELCDIITHKESILPSKNQKWPKAKKIDASIWQDELGRTYKVSNTYNELVCIQDPTAKKPYRPENFPEDIDPAAFDETCYDAFNVIIDEFCEERFVLAPAYLYAMVLLGGMEKGLAEYIANPQLVKEAGKKYLAHDNAMSEKLFRPGFSGVLLGEDYGTTRAPIISPQMFKEFCLPLIKARCQNVKQYVDYIFLHSCGNTEPLLDMFIEAGIDCLQSLQDGAGMDIGKLQKKYTGRIIFWGGISVEILLAGSTDDVRKNVRDACQKAKKGGIILGPSHSITYGVPYDNFAAMLDEFEKNCRY
jgi:uroporphyrinogen-III decarboxylase